MTTLNDFSGTEQLDSNAIKAHELAKKQREISIAEFFEKNRHLLGFDNKRKALMTTVKEAVDNSLDACEEAGILPELNIEIIEMGEDRFRIIVEDNGPGIVKKQIPKIFAKLLYGSKFHSLKQSRGQQGIGISASVMYSQLTTGKPAKITSTIGVNQPSHYYELGIDTQKNTPKILKDEIVEWDKEHGTKIELDLEAAYQKGIQSVDEYLKQTAIINPHTTIIYTNPKAEQFIYARATDNLPVQPREIRPHPYGIEIGILIKMLSWTNAKTLQQFFTTEFERIGAKTAKDICEKAGVLIKTKPRSISREQAERLIKAIRVTKIIAPPTDCVKPLGPQLVEKGLKKEINAEFFVSTTRPPAVYRGNPFIIEAGIAYGGELTSDNQIKILRFANSVPLLYQQGACGITDAIIETGWRNYGISQSQKSVPVGPATVLVHMASVWVPFTSEAKEALAHYPEITKEIKLALQECGRKLASYVNKKKRVNEETKKRSYLEKYVPHIGIALKELLALSDQEESRINNTLRDMLEDIRGKVELEPDGTQTYSEELKPIINEENGVDDEQERRSNQ
ncbi:DNA topoisomerase VI subunit B [Candidatus Woesearchaeota archaeon]|nr:DNA topoisomerase VI subunit B [Candidatus Woesearchaeota archaeon]